MAMTGGLGPNGKSALLAWKIWEEDVNAKGGLLGRKVKLVYYDDQSNPSTVPGIYTKLLDVDKVDLAGCVTFFLCTRSGWSCWRLRRRRRPRHADQHPAAGQRMAAVDDLPGRRRRSPRSPRSSTSSGSYMSPCRSGWPSQASSRCNTVVNLAAFTAAVVLSEVLIGVLKGVYERARPPESLVATTGASFPLRPRRRRVSHRRRSGHRLGATEQSPCCVWLRLVPYCW